ncbi:MAG: hypothetical protein QOH13_577 [Thermoleophilaceae bacterium]|nr:hypothetical protein [Thermoleophilaceae bacterium]
MFARAARRWTDDFLESYDLWRDRCVGVRIAYARWLDSDEPERTLAFRAYRSALESEDQAAQLHQRCAERLGEAAPAC